MAAMSRASAIASVLLVVLLAVSVAAASGKKTQLRVYWHDVVTGPSPTVVQVAEAATSNRSATGFGSVFVIDDPLTKKPELSSRLVGRAQGMYVSAGKDSISLLMTMNFVFLERAYNGSSIAIMGRNAASSAVREMPVVGGTGAFRWARGYVEARTHFLDNSTGAATVEYNVFLWH